MATLTMRYTTQKKYDALSEEEKMKQGYIYYVRSSSNYGGDFNSYWTLGKCYGAVPSEGEVTGMVQINNIVDLPAIGKPNTLYAYFDEFSKNKEMSLFIWDSINLRYHKLEETYDVIDGGDATSKTNVTYNK